MIEHDCLVPVREQCRLLEVPRSTVYYTAKGETEENQMLMRRIDELYTENPAWGSRKIRDRLRLEGHQVNRKRVQRLMRLMAIEAIYPKRDTSRPDPKAGIYPYLLHGLDICHANQVWCADITYIRLKHGFVYLCAILDWYSRKVLAWELSTTMNKYSCIAALERAIREYGTPAIFNTDQGAQFTSSGFTGILKEEKIRVSMDGKNRALDNIVVERFWRSLKYEEVYLKDYADVNECRLSITNYIESYNSFRPHQSLDHVVPNTVYESGLRSLIDFGDQPNFLEKVS